MRVAVLISVIATSLVASLSAFAEDKPSRFFKSPCWFGFVVGDRIECGYVEVPEDWNNPGSRWPVLLQVVRFRSEQDQPQADPVLFIDGGPGGESFSASGNFDAIDSWLGLSAEIRKTRDFIVFDQRGVGRSIPSLDCPEMHDWPDSGAETYSRLDWMEFEQERLAACFDRIIQADVNPDHFDTAQSARDVLGILDAFGYERANLWAVSYGTRIALEVIRQQQGQIRAAILDGVYPVDRQLIGDEPAQLERVALEMIELCRNDVICHGAFPDLEGDMRHVLAALEKDPVEVDFGSGKDPLVLDAEQVVNSLRLAFQHPDDLKRVPLAVYRAVGGDYRSLADLGREDLVSDTESEGRFFATQCRENTPFIDERALQENMELHHPFGIGANEAPSLTHCRAIDITPVEKSFSDPVTSDLPILMLSGRFDATTPPEWAAHAAESLPNAINMVIADGGHGVSFNHACAQEALAGYLEQPAAFTPPDCVHDKADILFDTADTDY